jgi:TPR repeat protein
MEQGGESGVVTAEGEGPPTPRRRRARRKWVLIAAVLVGVVVLYAIPITRIGFLIVACRAGKEDACMKWAETYEAGAGVARNTARTYEIAAETCARFRSQQPCTLAGFALWAGWSKQGGRAEAEALCTTDTGDDRYASLCERLSTIVLGASGVQGDPKEKAIQLALRSCALGHASGCSLAERMDTVAERVQLLNRVGTGCQQGDKAACAQLIEVYKQSFGAKGAPP